MFEDKLTRVDRGERQRRILAFSIAAVVLAVAAFFILRARGPSDPGAAAAPSGLEGALRDGAPEFEAYKHLVTIDRQVPVSSENLLGQVTVVVRGMLHNSGDRDLSGVELQAVVYGADGGKIAERTAVPVPRLQSKLAAGQSMTVHVNIDPVPKGAIATNGVIVLRGLRFD